MKVWIAAFVCCAMVATSLPAQRSRLSGRVVDAAGKAVVGAKVRLISRVLPTSDLGKLDVVDTETRQRGAFRAQLLHGRSYSAWASWEVDGAKRYSMVIDGVRAGARPKFVEASKPFTARKLEIKGRDRVARLAPLTLRLRWGCETYFVEDLELVDGHVALPDLPYSTKHRPKIQVRSKDGMLITSTSISATSRRSSVTLPKLHEQVIRVTSNDEPIEGAVITGQVGWGSEWSIVGKSGKDGEAICTLPRGGGTKIQNMVFRIDAPGYEGSSCGWSYNRGWLNDAMVKEIPGRWDVQLDKASPFSGRVLGFDGKPLAGAIAVLKWQGYYRRSKNSRSGYQTPELRRVSGPDGVVSFEGLRDDASNVNLRLLLPDAMEFPEILEGYPPPPRILYLWASRNRKKGEKIGDIDLSKARLLRVDVTANGQPARDAIAVISEIVDFNGWRAKLSRCDRRGRATRLVTGEKSTLFVFDRKQGWYAEEFDEVPNEAMKVELKPFNVFSGKVTDAEGTPVPGVQISSSGWSQWGSVAFSSFKSQMNSQLLNGKTDAEGRFKIHFVAIGNRKTTLSFSHRNGSQRLTASFELQAESVENEEIKFGQRLRKVKKDEKPKTRRGGKVDEGVDKLHIKRR